MPLTRNRIPIAINTIVNDWLPDSGTSSAKIDIVGVGVAPATVIDAVAVWVTPLSFIVAITVWTPGSRAVEGVNTQLPLLSADTVAVRGVE